MSNSFCKFLSNGGAFFKTNKPDTMFFAPCCWYSSPKTVTIPIKETVDKAIIEFNSIKDWTSDCNQCKLQEESGMHSLRQTSFELIKDDLSPGDIVSLDINLDSNCNAACVICNPHLSTLWAKEYNKHTQKKFTINTLGDHIDRQIDDIFESANFKNLKLIKFFGGEPLFTDTHLKLLKKIKEPKNITLHYTTNGSIYPTQEIMEIWETFRTVLFCVSIDGVEKQFDYIRWPLNWNKVTNNLLRLRDTSPVNILFRLEYTVNFMNAFYYKEFEDWAKENFNSNRLGDPVEINLHHYFGKVWDLGNMNEEHKKMIIEKHGRDHKISSVVINIKTSNNLKHWQEFVEKWDPIRENSWKTAFPELVHLYE